MLLQGNTVTTQAKLGTTWETSQSALASAQTNPRQKPHWQITSSWFTDRWIKALCWFQEELPHWLSETGVVMENVVLSRGFQVTSLECPFTCVCVGPTFVWASLPKHSNPQSRERWNPVWTRRSVNPLSPAERGGGEEGQQHAETLTQLITHSDNWEVPKERLLRACPYMTLSGDTRHTDWATWQFFRGPNGNSGLFKKTVTQIDLQ